MANIEPRLSRILADVRREEARKFVSKPVWVGSRKRRGLFERVDAWFLTRLRGFLGEGEGGAWASA